MHSLQSPSIQQKHTLDDITDKIVELGKGLASLQLRVYSKDIDVDRKN